MRIVGIVAFLVAVAAGAPAAGQDHLDRLQAEIDHVAPSSGGLLGAGVYHLETGREVYVRGDDHFPMASSFKVPIAVQLLTLVDQGKVRLDSMITLQPSDLHPGSGTISNLLNDPGVSLSVRNLLELMLLISDNSATDILLKLVGGADQVNGRLKALGVSGISVNRPTIELIADASGIKSLPPEAERTQEGFRTLRLAVTEQERKAAVEAFNADNRDTATPKGMAALLRKVWKGEALSPANTALLMDIMFRCQTGEARIKGLLPADVKVAHKTGTLGIGVTADVGVIELPNNGGHLIVTLFVKQSSAAPAAQERAIAQAARAAYDYFLFNPGR
ncbi:MAG: class A beta-lactamase [Gemmatimonadota bacterium]